MGRRHLLPGRPSSAQVQGRNPVGLAARAGGVRARSSSPLSAGALRFPRAPPSGRNPRPQPIVPLGGHRVATPLLDGDLELTPLPREIEFREPGPRLLREPATSSETRTARSTGAGRRRHRSAMTSLPSTGRTRGACPGYEVDQVRPLACGGPDAPSNMQWVTKAENRAKGSEGCRR